MDTVDGKSNAPSGENQNASNAPSDVSAETPPRTQLQHHIHSQRAQLLQAHSVLACLYEVLLHAEGEDAIVYAEAAHVAANLIINTIEELDSVRLGPLIDALVTIPGGQGSRNRVLYLT